MFPPLSSSTTEAMRTPDPVSRGRKNTTRAIALSTLLSSCVHSQWQWYCDYDFSYALRRLPVRASNGRRWSLWTPVLASSRAIASGPSHQGRPSLVAVAHARRWYAYQHMSARCNDFERIPRPRMSTRVPIVVTGRFNATNQPRDDSLRNALLYE